MRPALTYCLILTCALGTVLVAAGWRGAPGRDGDGRLDAAAELPLAPTSLPDAAARALSDDAAEAGAAVAQLRAAGRAGLDALIEANDGDLERIDDETTKPLAVREPYVARLHDVLDAVAGQRDAHASRLFWHTDLDAARAEARASGRPILSLRMLGRLDEELSCANSRFFRTVLYANTEISRALRDGFVLHWQSEMPVPKVTIEYGDGRRIVTTLTGNSIHYVLDADGGVIDALPGLYGPGAFLRGVQQAADAARQAASLTGEERDAYLRAWHVERLAAIDAQVQGDRASCSAAAIIDRDIRVAMGQPASFVAASKMAAERPVADAAAARTSTTLIWSDEDEWRCMGERHAGDARLDDASTALARAKLQGAEEGLGFQARRRPSDPLGAALARFELRMAADTVRNETEAHRTIHLWLGAEGSRWSLETLNDAVYGTLFETPIRDPWLGLLRTYTALPANGRVE